MQVILVLCLIIALFALALGLVRRMRFVRSLNTIPGPRALPIVGNALQLTGSQHEFFKLLITYANNYGDLFRLWIGTRPFVFLYKADTVQALLSSNQHTEKSIEYKFLKPWIGEGLLTSSGEKWHARRKLLTGSFHFQILEKFIEPIYRESLVLVEKLSDEIGKQEFDVVPYAKLCSLDIICDNAMGVHINAQRNRNHEYVTAVDRMLDPPSVLAAALVCRKWLKLCRSDPLIRFQVKRQLRHERRMKIDPLRSEIVVLRDTREVKPLAPLNGRLQIFVQLDSDMPDEIFERKPAAKKPAVQRSRASSLTSQKILNTKQVVSKPPFSRSQSLRF